MGIVTTFSANQDRKEYRKRKSANMCCGITILAMLTMIALLAVVVHGASNGNAYHQFYRIIS